MEIDSCLPGAWHESVARDAASLVSDDDCTGASILSAELRQEVRQEVRSYWSKLTLAYEMHIIVVSLNYPTFRRYQDKVSHNVIHS